MIADILSARTREYRPANALEQERVLAELLQHYVLARLSRAKLFSRACFHGGTFLRICHGLLRFSEDLDFSLERDIDDWDLERSMRSLESELFREGYEIETTADVRRTVNVGWVKVTSLYHERGFSPRREEKVSVKVEVDTRPSSGAVLETRVVRRHVTLHLQHHDPSSLLAGKVHALLSRPFAKGRDIFDLIWYLADRSWPAPNFVLLRNALAQTGWSGPGLESEGWREVLSSHLQGLDWKQFRRDVEPFLEDPSDLDLMTSDNVGKLLRFKAG